MRPSVVILFMGACMLLVLFNPLHSHAQKNRKDKHEAGRPRIMATFGDSLRTDSIVVYETEIGYVMPDHSQKFLGKWNISVMRRQARAVPDTLVNATFEFIDDTLFHAFLGCDSLSGSYTIKG